VTFFSYRAAINVMLKCIGKTTAGEGGLVDLKDLCKQSHEFYNQSRMNSVNCTFEKWKSDPQCHKFKIYASAVI